jgi:hypothetical protein
MGESDRYALSVESEKAPGISQRSRGRMRTAIFSYENTLLAILGIAFALMILDGSAVATLSPFLVKELRFSATGL